MSSRLEFVLFAMQPGANVRELCRRFGISPKTGYKWLLRYQQTGPQGLHDLSRRPHHSPRQTPPECESELVRLREQYPYWGGRKLAHLLPPDMPRPSPSTVTAILSRHGCLPPDDSAHPSAPRRFEFEQPNQLWQMDFKGHFPLTQTGRCFPLTILDDHSRFSLCLQACANQQRPTVQEQLTRVFRHHGLPERILTDNGAPWGGRSPSGLSSLGAWLLRLGIALWHGQPYHPQTQGKEERFHRTLKRELLDRRGFSSLSVCQQAFDDWRHQYNYLRPHEALDLKPPIQRYRPSARPFPEVLPPLEYDQHDQVRKVSRTGDIRFLDQRFFVAEALAGEHVAVRPTCRDGVWEVFYCQHPLRRITLS